jgi:MFS family permease
MREALFQLSAAAAYFAQGIFSYTIIIYVQALTGTAESGMLFVGLYLPNLLLGLKAGAVADRYPRKRILVTCQAMIVAVSAAALGVVAWSHRPHTLLLLLLLSPLYGSALAFLPATRMAYTSNLVSSEALQRATSLLKIFNIAAGAGGPFIAGWVKARAGWTVLFAVPVGLWLFSTLAMLPLRDLHVSTPAPNNTRSWREVFEGLRVIRDTPLLRGLCLLSCLVFCLVSGPYQVLVPAFTKDVLHASEIQRGTLMGIFGAGMLAGGILSAVLSGVRARGRLLVGTLLPSTILFLVFSYQTSYQLSLVLVGLCGTFGGIFYSLVPTTLQFVTPDQLRGRVLSVYYVLVVGSPALGAVVFAWLTDRLNIVIALRLAAFGAVAVGVLSLLALPSVRRYTTDHEAGVLQPGA